MGKRSRKRRVPVFEPPAEGFVGRVRQSWRIAGQQPAARGLVEVDPAVRRSRPQRPASRFGALPELVILTGIVLFALGIATGEDGVAGELFIAGILVAGVGVFEVCAREHFAGYRSHVLLLALLTALGVHALYALTLGDDGIRAVIVLVLDLAVFAAAAWWLRGRFDRRRRG